MSLKYLKIDGCHSSKAKYVFGELQNKGAEQNRNIITSRFFQ